MKWPVNRVLMLAALMVVIISPRSGFGHGEDKPGPNGGLIRMPGTYHVELVPLSKHQVRVYLLDIDWKNPSVVNSTVQIRYVGKKKGSAKCAVRDELFFLCTFPKEIDLSKKGTLLVSSQREEQKGNVVTYELPLKHPHEKDGSGSQH